MVGNQPVGVRGTPEFRTSERPARLLVEVLGDAPPSSSGAGSTRLTRKVSVTFTELVKQLADGWEKVDGTYETT